MKTIAIVSWKDGELGPWDPESVGKGIGGSEEAIIYMSAQLAKLGYRVLVFAYPPSASIHAAESANPRYLCIDAIWSYSADIAIAWRRHDMGVQLRKWTRRVFFWPHDTCNFVMTQEEMDSYEEILWLTHWQREQWCVYTPALEKFKTVVGNGVDSEQFAAIEERKNPYSCIYGSNYGRGLALLALVWPAIKQLFPRATLDIYYGWQHWNSLPPMEEKKLRASIEALQPLAVREHGKVGHLELNRAFGQSSFWTYPCIFSEVFCITALRAQMAGAIPVILALPQSCLKETVRHGYACSEQRFYLATLHRAMSEAETISLSRRRAMGDFIRKEFTWAVQAARWKEIFG